MQNEKIRITYFTNLALAFSIACGAVTGCAGPEESQQPEAAVNTKAISVTGTGVDKTQSSAGAVAFFTPTTAGTLLSRTVVNPPAFNHPAVSEASIQAVKNAILALPSSVRAKLDQLGARVIIAPNMIDRWPDSVKDLDEKNPLPNLAEQPGRIYGPDMCVYERPKKRGTTDLGPARTPAYIQLQVGDMCFQVLDGDAMTLSKDPDLRKEYEADKKEIPQEAQIKVAEFTKLDDWGARETCAEMFGSMMGGRNENTDNLYKYFPRVKKWLIAKLGIKES